jgi:hypothetical protein
MLSRKRLRMKKLSLLLLDANIVIKLFEADLWDAVISRCELLLTETVVDEANYYETDDEQHPIDITSHLEAGQVRMVDVEPSQVKAFIDKFDPTYLERLDPGEAEALTYLNGSSDPCSICSADSIVFRALGRLRLSERGVSLEEILQKIGMGRSLDWPYQKAFREKYTAQGTKDAIQGFGLMGS